MLVQKTIAEPKKASAGNGEILRGKPLLSPAIQEEILQWIELAPPRRTLRHLRKMMIAWMLREQSGFPVDFEEMITDLDCLFELLDSIQDEIGEDAGSGGPEEHAGESQGENADDE
ncbi:MAG: hypothetical protein P4L51_27990 [Puia sp.]|nr:hypothetical protein [Puia sp.]